MMKFPFSKGDIITLSNFEIDSNDLTSPSWLTKTTSPFLKTTITFSPWALIALISLLVKIAKSLIQNPSIGSQTCNNERFR